MSTTSKGKIGRLPKTLRDEVNRRLENGEKGASLVAWLNSKPEVQAMLEAEFQGKPIREQNLSDWRKYGYKNWARRREAQTMAAEIGDLPCADNSPVTDQVATWVSVRYLMTVRELVESTGQGPSRLKVLHEFCEDLVALRRGEQRSARLKMQQERLASIFHEPDSGTGVPPVRFESSGRDARATAKEAVHGPDTPPIFDEKASHKLPDFPCQTGR